MIVKRSLSIQGHRTSISIEDAFWIALKRIAARKGTSLSQLVAEVDAGRATQANLSSALRVFVLSDALGVSEHHADADAAPSTDE